MEVVRLVDKEEFVEMTFEISIQSYSLLSPNNLINISY